ncbi:hypothetical protein PLICRDRAFT_674207 [Plicaturopsis crispa FD-325 SS-3]|nr:hypothetical protein PLICRDRAFT_674207 [Plicaturopsis crispa FD-325 SS-3]
MSNTASGDGVSEVATSISYVTKVVSATPSVAHMRNPRVKDSPRPESPAETADPVPCVHLQGPQYLEYILRTQTRTLGGVSFAHRARIVRYRLFPYKFPPEGSESKESSKVGHGIKVEVPADGNRHTSEPMWTAAERRRHDDEFKAWAVWEVDFAGQFVRASRCTGVTTNESGVCDECMKVAGNESLKHAIRAKNREAKLPIDVQGKLQAQRNKYSATNGILAIEGRTLQGHLRDPLLFKVFHELERGNHTATFLELYKHAIDGNLKESKTFTEICDVFADRLRRETSDNTNLKYGIRYPQNYLNFMTLVRSYGSQSARQYAIITGQLGGPSPRRLRALVADSEHSLQNPYLVMENVARVKRLADTLHYTGAIIIGGDCTKVRKRLSYSNDFGSHVLGSVLPLDECEVEDGDDIDLVIANVKEQNDAATQVRAILAKLPLPQIPPLVVALIPTNGKDDAKNIHEQLIRFQRMAAELGLPLVGCSADGASAETSAQCLMDQEPSELPPLTYDNALYGVHVKAPVFKVTGPLVSIQDAPHGKKTSRNQPQHGTHTASLGKGHLVSRSLVRLCETGESGLMLRDVQNVDKQEDGPARRLFSYIALLATTTGEGASNEERAIKDEFIGLFVYLFIFGELFDAWMSRRLSVRDRVVAVMRARFFLHFWWAHIEHMSQKFPDLYSTARSSISPASFNIFNRLCDSLLLLVIAYARFYPDQPFCPWLMGTDFVEHFFGLARMLLPNFTYAEFLKMVKHVMLRQHLLLSGKFNEKRERTSGAGYTLDYDATPLTEEELLHSRVALTTHDIHQLVEVGYQEAVAICKDILCMPVPSLPLTLKVLKPGSQHKSRAKAPAAGHSDDDTDSDPDRGEFSDSSDESEDDTDGSNLSIGETTAEAALDTARYSDLCDDYELTLQEVQSLPDAEIAAPSEASTSEPAELPTTSSIVLDSQLPRSQAPSPPIVSQLLDNTLKISVFRMLEARRLHQAGTAVKSERIVRLDPKFVRRQEAAAAAAQRPEAPGRNEAKSLKMSIKEASHRVRIAQDLDPDIVMAKPATTREQRWKSIAKEIQRLVTDSAAPNLEIKNVTVLFPLCPGSFVIMRNAQRFYIGEVLDIYKKGNNSRYGSLESAVSVSGLAFLSLRVYVALEIAVAESSDDDDDAMDVDSDIGPRFTCCYRKSHMHTHAPLAHLVYHIGGSPFESSSFSYSNATLKPFEASRWRTLTRPTVRRIILKLGHKS